MHFGHCLQHLRRVDDPPPDPGVRGSREEEGQEEGQEEGRLL